MRIFVYGTLKRGCSNHAHLSGQQFVREAVTAPRYRLVDCGGYPGMVPAEDAGTSVKGEVWEVDERGLEVLDLLEDVAVGLYAVERVSLLGGDAAEDVYTYIYKWSVEGLPDVGSEWVEDS